MGANQLKFGVILTYLATGLNMLIQLIYTPVMIRLLGQSEYGIYTLTGSIASYLGVLSFGFNTAYIRFYMRVRAENDKNAVARLNGMFLLLFSGISILALICGLLMVSFSDIIFGTKLSAHELFTAKSLLAILVVNVAMTLLSSLFEAMTSAYEQFVYQRILNLAGIIFNPLICLPLLMMGYGSVALILVTTIITFAKLVMNIWFCTEKLHITFAFKHFDFLQLREIGIFSFFIFLNLLINEVNVHVDKLILANTDGSNTVAVYGVGSQINTLFVTFASAVSSVFVPRVNMLIASGNDGKSKLISDIFIRVARFQFVVLGLITSGFIFFGNYFITEIYVGREYKDSYAIALLLMLPSFIPICQNIGLEIQRALNRHKFRAVVYSILAVMNVIISIFLAKYYGAIGAAAGTAISLIIGNLFIMNIYYRKTIGLDMCRFWKNILHLFKSILIPIGLGILILMFIKIESAAVFLIWVCIYTIVYSISCWIFGLNKDEKTMIFKLFKKGAR